MENKTLKIASNLHEKLKKLSEDKNTSLQYLIEEKLEELISHEEDLLIKLDGIGLDNNKIKISFSPENFKKLINLIEIFLTNRNIKSIKEIEHLLSLTSSMKAFLPVSNNIKNTTDKDFLAPLHSDAEIPNVDLFRIDKFNIEPEIEDLNNYEIMKKYDYEKIDKKEEKIQFTPYEIVLKTKFTDFKYTLHGRINDVYILSKYLGENTSTVSDPFIICNEFNLLYKDCYANYEMDTEKYKFIKTKILINNYIDNNEKINIYNIIENIDYVEADMIMILKTIKYRLIDLKHTIIDNHIDKLYALILDIDNLVTNENDYTTLDMRFREMTLELLNERDSFINH